MLTFSEPFMDGFRKLQALWDSVYGFPGVCVVDTGAVNVWQPDKINVNTIRIYEPAIFIFLSFLVLLQQRTTIIEFI